MDFESLEELDKKLTDMKSSLNYLFFFAWLMLIIVAAHVVHHW